MLANTVLSPEFHQDFDLYDKDMLAGANIMPRTGFATDYLNVFNEATMLFGLLGDMPEMIEELEIWQPLTYEEHFLRSNFHDKELAIAVFKSIPDERRLPFVDTAHLLGEMIVDGIKDAKAKIAAGEDIADFASETSFALQSVIMMLDGMMHGHEADNSQDDVDALFD
ncbi:MAG: hypothetical protein FD163_792 [Hyphomonadaceae bacterium]|nr:MAG: hypothetical protein FD128_1454 [Hyphomonadaceae bacterium]KAF0186124.1 MAG: hypothetical protein FD163_792 [Hyphomonadaceae bacterium]